MKRNKFWLVLVVLLIVILILQIVDIFVVDIPFIYGSYSGLIACIAAIVLDLINYYGS